jgi:hypothetical protein
MTRITVDLPDNLLGEITKGSTTEGLLEERLPELLRLGLMAGKSSTDIYKYVLDFIVSNPSHEEVLKFKPTAAMQARLQDLLAKSASQQLSLVEEQELNEYERIEHLIVMIKSGSLRYLQ